MNPYQPPQTRDVSDTVPEVELHNPIITKLFSFVPVFIAIRSSFFLTWNSAQNKLGDFVMDHLLSGVAAWLLAVIASIGFGIFYLAALRHFLAKQPELADNIYGVFGVCLLLGCAAIVILPSIIFGWA